MAVPLEFISVVVRRATLEARYPGGLEGYERDCGGGSFAVDEHLTRVGFMGSTDVESFVRRLEQKGLTLLRDEVFDEIAIVDELGGPSRPCDWLEWDRGRCWLAGMQPGDVAAPRWLIEEREGPCPAGRSLLGLAMGDCLGAGVEGMSAEEIRNVYASTSGYVRRFRYEPMVWTDDTQQALTLLESVKRFGVPDADWVARRWVEMADRRLHRGTGRGFRGSVADYARSGDARTSGRIDRAGNGAAMRIAPAAVALRGLPDQEFVDRLIEVSLVTHREGRALVGMLAVAFVARALAEEQYPLSTTKGTDVLARMIPWLRDQESRLAGHPSVVLDDLRLRDVSDAFAGVRERSNRGWGAVAQWIEAYASARRGEPTRLGEGYVLASVVAAVSWVLCADLTFPTMLVEAVGFGDDADTVAAMCGGMAGAAAPGKSLPPEWDAFAGRDELVAWGRALDRNDPVEDLPDVLKLEARLTRIVRG